MLHGIASSPGEGVGPALVLQEREIPETALKAGSTDIHVETERFEAGVKIAAAYYEKTRERVAQKIGEEEAEIFEGYLELLTGDDMSEGVNEALESGALTATGAVLSFCSETAADFEEMESEYFRQRAADIRDIGKRLAEAIHFGDILDVAAVTEASVIIAHELSPAYTVSLDLDYVSAIATVTGGPTSHAAILARSLSIPCITGAEGLLEQVKTGDFCLVNGSEGYIETGISEEKARQILEKNRAQRLETERMREWSRNTEAVLSDGSEIRLKANVSSAADARRAVDAGARGSGLVRTEFIYMSFDDFPTVEQQIEYYREICLSLQPHPVTIRLLDCGADKPLPYANQKSEDNPFLGERGIRFLMNRKNILRDQLSALSQLYSQGFNVKAMIPMVISVDEIREVRAMLSEMNSDMPLGIMVETPASVLRIDALASESDFISVGTNDLTQYILAVDRGNAEVSGLYQELHPAVISALSRVVEACAAASIPLSVCGDMASRAPSALALLALGVRELSASSSAVPKLKEMICSLDSTELERINAELHSCERHDHCSQFLSDKLAVLMGSEW